MTIDVPGTWADVDGSAWILGERNVGVAIRAAPDLSGYFDTWTTPGLFIGVSRALGKELDTGHLLDRYSLAGECTHAGRRDYRDPPLTGRVDTYTGCGGGETVAVVLAAAPQDRSFAVVAIFQLLTAADAEAAERAVDSLAPG